MLRLIGIVLGVATIYAFYRLTTADGRKTVAPTTSPGDLP